MQITTQSELSGSQLMKFGVQRKMTIKEKSIYAMIFILITAYLFKNYKHPDLVDFIISIVTFFVFSFSLDMRFWRNKDKPLFEIKDDILFYKNHWVVRTLVPHASHPKRYIRGGKMTFKNTVVAISFAVLCVVNPAYAGSNAAPSADWEGPYAGLTAGLSYGKFDPTVRTQETLNYFDIITDRTQVGSEGSHQFKDTEAVGSLFWGINRQAGSFVYGFETDMSLINYKEQYDSPRIAFISAPKQSFNVSINLKSNWAFSARPRVGYVLGKSFFYISGGPELRRFKYDFTYSDRAVNNEYSTISKDKWALGWTAGLGYEHKMPHDWSLRAEYFYSQYTDIIHSKSDLKNWADGFTHELDFEARIFRIGVSKAF